MDNFMEMAIESDDESEISLDKINIEDLIDFKVMTEIEDLDSSEGNVTNLDSVKSDLDFLLDPLLLEKENIINEEKLENAPTLLDIPNGDDVFSSYANDIVLVHYDNQVPNILQIAKTETTMYYCNFCKYETDIRVQFNVHMYYHKQELRRNTKTIIKKKFSCKHCSYRTHRELLWQAHVRIHGAANKFPCTNCSFKCHSKELLVKHSEKCLFGKLKSAIVVNVDALLASPTE